MAKHVVGGGAGEISLRKVVGGERGDGKKPPGAQVRIIARAWRSIPCLNNNTEGKEES